MLNPKTAGCLTLLCTLALPAGAQDSPKWLLDAKARETQLGKLREVTSTDGWLKTKVHGTLKEKIVLEDGGYPIELLLDGNVTVSCAVIKDSPNLANFLSRLAEHSFRAIEQVHGQIEARAVEASDAGSLGGAPFLALQWIYRANHNGEKRVGGLKQFVADLDQAVVYCMNDDLGYSKSFDTVAKTIASQLSITGEKPPKAHFRDVSVVSLDGTRVGVAATTMTKDPDGDTKVVTMSAMVMQSAPGKLITEDTFNVEWVRPDGSLINALKSKMNNGELNEDMALKKHEGKWKVSGTLAGKDIEAELPSAPRSFVEMSRDRQRLMAQANPEGAKTEAMAWMSQDLTRLLPVRSTLLKPVGSNGFSAREELSGVSLEAVLDKRNGTMMSAKMPIGARQLTIDRVDVQGEF